MEDFNENRRHEDAYAFKNNKMNRRLGWTKKEEGDEQSKRRKAKKERKKSLDENALDHNLENGM